MVSFSQSTIESVDLEQVVCRMLSITMKKSVSKKYFSDILYFQYIAILVHTTVYGNYC